jgi:hypothetical protein
VVPDPPAATEADTPETEAGEIAAVDLTASIGAQAADIKETIRVMTEATTVEMRRDIAQAAIVPDPMDLLPIAAATVTRGTSGMIARVMIEARVMFPVREVPGWKSREEPLRTPSMKRQDVLMSPRMT